MIGVGGGVSQTKAVEWLRRQDATPEDPAEVLYTISLKKPRRKLTVRLIGWRDVGNEFQAIGVPSWLEDFPASFFVSLYRARFGIETSYRESNEIRPMTTATNPSLRYALMFIALAFYNATSVARLSPSVVHVPQQRLWKRLKRRVLRQDPEAQADASLASSTSSDGSQKFVPLPRKPGTDKERVRSGNIALVKIEPNGVFFQRDMPVRGITFR